MALKGAGDPRWVVRERDDGRNVNGWHWEDKDVTGWAKERLKELIAEQTCSTSHPIAKVAVASVDTVDGDATLYNRKGVLKVLYDLKIAGKWTSLQPEKDERTHGEFKFELFDEDPEVSVTMDAKSKSVSELKKAFVTDVVPLIKKHSIMFIRELHAGAGQALDGVALPEKQTSSDTKVSDYLRSGMDQAPVKKMPEKTGELVVKDVFNCYATDMYLALTDKARLEAITRGRTVSEATVGGKLNLMDGVVSGTYKKLLIGKEIGMDWKMKAWGDDAAAADLTISMETDEGKTEVVLRIRGVPNAHRSSTEGFWRLQIFRVMKMMMGWGMSLNL